MIKYRLMVPGPTPTPPDVGAAGALPLIDERTPEFAGVFRRVTENLQRLFLTDNEVLTFTSSMTGAFEGVFQNLFSEGDRVLVATNGVFGDRWVQMGRAYRLDVIELSFRWGMPVDNDRVAAAVAADPSIRGAVVVLCETSTGTVNDVRGFAAAAGDALAIVDAASGLGACELRTDEWGLDVVVAGSQKALMCPPGLAFVSIGERAWAAHRTASLPRFYFDWGEARHAYRSDVRTPWTPAISLIVQLDRALERIVAEGLENVFARHVRLGRAARAGLRGIGFELVGPDDDRSAAVTAARTPHGIDAERLVEVLAADHGVQITGGHGPLKGDVVRIGHCGYVDVFDVALTLAAVEIALHGFGHPVEFGRGVGAALRVHAAADRPAARRAVDLPELAVVT